MRRAARGTDRLTDWIRRLLFAGGLLCLGYWGWAQADAWHYQAEQSHRFDRMLAAEAAALDEEVAMELAAAEARTAADPGPSGEAPGTLPPQPPDAAAEPAVQPAAQRREAGSRAAAPGAAAAPRAIARLRIPRIGLSTMVADGADPTTLRRSAGRVSGTARPGDGGNVAVAGHRDTVFRRLEHAAPGDTVLLETAGGTLRYRVESVAVVAPDAVEVLAPTAEPTLTLITCYPFSMLGPAPERYVVRARRLGAP
ncbi:MAG TPA: class D sortase [Thermoanaerobaculia bacterium]|nr:class D sortase [Thermoanaerobaculia bacterium]